MNAPKQKRVNVDEVSVSTLSVEIKTISVGRRQMSMALFRQLPRAPLIDVDDDDFRLNGMPWGRVNYHWDGCFHPPGVRMHVDAHVHVHVLWQRDNVLFQSAVAKAPPLFDDYDDQERQRLTIKDRYCEIGALVAVIKTDAEITRDGTATRVGRWLLQNDHHGTLFQMMQSFRGAPDGSSYREQLRENMAKKIVGLCIALDLGDSPDTEEEAWSLFEQFTDEFGALRVYHARQLLLYEKRYEELLAIEQLFIAA